jgi:hypothetical protein
VQCFFPILVIGHGFGSMDFETLQNHTSSITIQLVAKLNTNLINEFQLRHVGGVIRAASLMCPILS